MKKKNIKAKAAKIKLNNTQTDGIHKSQMACMPSSFWTLKKLAKAAAIYIYIYI